MLRVFPHVDAWAWPQPRADRNLLGWPSSPSRLSYYLLSTRERGATLAERGEPVILPTESSISIGFDSLVARLGMTPMFAATVGDMAMIRLLARNDVGLAIPPAVVLAVELAKGLLDSAPFPIDIVESFMP